MKKTFNGKFLTFLGVGILSVAASLGISSLGKDNFKKTLGAIGSTYTHVFASGDASSTSSTTKTWDGVNWTVSKANYVGFDNTKGLQIGSSGSPQKEDWTLSTSSAQLENKKIKSVTLLVSTASSGGINFNFNCGSNTYSESLGATTSVVTKTKTFDTPVSGDVTFKFNSNGKSKAIYIKSFTLEFVDETKSIVSVDSVAEAPSTIVKNKAINPEDVKLNVTYDNGDKGVTRATSVTCDTSMLGETTATAYLSSAPEGKDSATFKITVTKLNQIIVEISERHKTLNWADATIYRTWTDKDNFVTFDGPNAKYYNNGENWRLYNGNTLTISLNSAITDQNLVIKDIVSQESVNFDIADSGITATFAATETIKFSLFTINLEERKTLTNLQINGTPKSSFNTGEEFSFGDAQVIACFDNKETIDVTNNAEFSGYDLSSPGQQTVIVSYTYNGVTKTTTYDINVIAKHSVTITGGDSVEVGSTLELTASCPLCDTYNWTVKSGSENVTIVSGTSSNKITIKGKTQGTVVLCASCDGSSTDATISVLPRPLTKLAFQLDSKCNSSDSDSGTELSGESSNYFTNGVSNVKSVTSSKVYLGKSSSRSLKLGVKAGGTLSLAFNNDIYAKKIVLTGMMYGSDDTTITASVNEATTSSEEGYLEFSYTKSEFEDIAIDLSGKNTLSTLDLTFGARAYLKCISVYVDNPVSVEEVKLNKDNVQIYVGGTETLLATVLPEDASDKSVTWSSSNEDVVTVSDGTITGVGAGNATITVTTNDGNKQDTCNVTVVKKPNPLQSITLDKTESTMVVGGDTLTLTPTFTPSDADDKSVSWTSSNESICTVDNGVVTAVAAGNATIKVTSTVNENIYASCTITVTNPHISVTEVVLSSSSSVSLDIGETSQISASVLPQDASEKGILYSSSDNKIASVSESGLISAVAVGNATIKVAAKDNESIYKTVSVTVTDPTPVLENIYVKNAPSKTTYFVGEEFDPTGLVVMAHYDKGDDVEITNDVEITAPDMSVIGIANVTINYNGKTTTTPIEIIAKPAPTVVSIEIATTPKTSYFVGDTFDSKGLTIKVNWSEGESTTISSGFAISNPDMSTAGTKTVTVTYEGKTATFEITVTEVPAPELVSIAVTNNPSKTEYMVGEEFDPTGLVITATYSDQSTLPVEGYTLSEPDMSTAGTKTVTVTYEGKTATFDIVVSEVPTPVLESISVSGPTKTEYTVGEEFDSTGLIVTAHYSDQSESVISSGYQLSTPDMSTAGTKTVTVTYEGKTATFEITVTEVPAPELVSIAVTNNPSKTEYMVGEEFDPTGLVITATYSDQSTLPVEGYTLSEPDMSTAGTKTITVTYEGKTTTFNIVVNEQPSPEIPVLTEITLEGGRTEYKQGDGLICPTVIAHYSDGTTKIIKTGNYSVSDVDMNQIGDQEVIILYNEGDVTVSATFTIHIIERGEPTPILTGCGGNVLTTSIVISALAMAGIITILIRRKKED